MLTDPWQREAGHTVQGRTRKPQGGSGGRWAHAAGAFLVVPQGGAGEAGEQA